MKKTRELIEAHLKLVDVVIEVCDARIPVSSRNPIISELTAGKRRVLILNKKDLADEGATNAWLEYFSRQENTYQGDGTFDRIYLSIVPSPCHALALNSMSGQGVNALFAKLDRIAEEKTASGTSKSKLPVRLMIVGIPNSGKSSLINRLVGKRAAQVGDRPGVTRGKQWLSLENGMQLLDTPGILWPKFEDPEVGLNLAFCGSIRDEIMDIQDLALELMKVLVRDHAELLEERYGTGSGTGVSRDLVGGEKDKPAGNPRLLDSQEIALEVMEEIAAKRGYILPGKRIDYERTARALLDDFRSGKIGRITLEKAE